MSINVRGIAPLLLLAATLSACGGTSVEAASTDVGPKGQTVTGVPVVRVVDGDTLHVTVRGEDVTVRLIGIDSPESVKPNSPVECYGPESSDYAKSVLTGQRVTLEFDASQDRTDRYGRTLAYVWIEGPGAGSSLFNLAAVRTGNARERQYGPDAYAWKDAFTVAQQRAQAAEAGLWGACPG